MAVNIVHQAALRNSPHFQEAVEAVATEKALYKIATLPQDPTPEETQAANYAKALVQGRRQTLDLAKLLVARTTWDLTFDAWATAEATGDRYAIGAGLDELWPILSETM